MDPKLDIKITTSADTRGAQQATSALQGTSKAAAEAGSKTRAAGAQAKEGFDKFSKAGNDAASVVTNLETASKGGVAGLFGLANAMRSLIGIVRGAALATGPIGILVTVVGTLVGLFLSLRNNAQSAAAGIDKAAGSAKGLAQVSLDKTKNDLAQIASAAQLARTEFDRLQQSKARIDKAQTSATLAEIAVDPNLTEEERVRRTDAEQRAADSRDRDRRLASFRNAQSGALDAVSASSSVAGEAGTKLAGAESRLAALRAARQKRDAAELELSGLFSADGLEGRSREEINKAEARKTELRDVLDQTGGATDQAIADAQGEVDALKEVVAEAGAALAALVAALEKAAADLATESTTIAEEGAAAERKANAELGPKITAAKAQDAAAKSSPAAAAQAPTATPRSRDPGEIEADISAAETDRTTEVGAPLGGSRSANARVEGLRQELSAARDERDQMNQAVLQFAAAQRRNDALARQKLQKLSNQAKDARQ